MATDPVSSSGHRWRFFRSGGFNQSGVALAGVAGVFNTFDEQIADTLEIGWKTSRYKKNADAEWTVFGDGYDKVGAFQNQLENFAGVINGAQEPVITETDALASVAVIEEAYRSAQEHKWHELV